MLDKFITRESSNKIASEKAQLLKTIDTIEDAASDVINDELWDNPKFQIVRYYLEDATVYSPEVLRHLYNVAYSLYVELYRLYKIRDENIDFKIERLEETKDGYEFFKEEAKSIIDYYLKNYQAPRLPRFLVTFYYSSDDRIDQNEMEKFCRRWRWDAYVLTKFVAV